jgi:hypothetical protein
LLGFAAATLTSASLLPIAGAQASAKPSAEVRATAREAYAEGEAAFARSDFKVALENFEKANALIPSVNAQYCIAQSLDNLGRHKEAIIAYEQVLAHPDSQRLSQSKLDTSNERLKALKETDETTVLTPSSETPGGGTTAPEGPPPATPELGAGAPRDYGGETRKRKNRLHPQDNTWELGLFGGALFISRAHNLHEEQFFRRAYPWPSWLFGARVAYFPSKWLGVEAEYAHGRGEVEPDDSAQFNTARGHVIGQVAGMRFVPFALVGAGIIHANSDVQGSDADFLLEAGAGFKVSVTEVFAPRLEFRLDMHQREDGLFAFSKEVLLGATFTLGR